MSKAAKVSTENEVGDCKKLESKYRGSILKIIVKLVSRWQRYVYCIKMPKVKNIFLK